jgi:hypothetical protein
VVLLSTARASSRSGVEQGRVRGHRARRLAVARSKDLPLHYRDPERELLATWRRRQR